MKKKQTILILLGLAAWSAIFLYKAPDNAQRLPVYK
jgi:hypothetical protein